MKRLMEIAGLAMDPVTRSPVMILRDPESKMGVPIWIGPFEADSIRMVIEKQPPPRPITHDLFAEALNRLNGKVSRVEISDLKDNTYFAKVIVEAGGREVELDSRPSDAVSMAVRFDAPVYMSQHVFEAARISLSDEDDAAGETTEDRPAETGVTFDESNKDKWAELLENIKPEQLSKYKM